MSNKNIQTRKQRTGERVFREFDKHVTDNLFSKAKYTESIVLASDVADEMSFVTLPLYQNGILRLGEKNTSMLHAFQPNLWAQDFAFKEGKLDKMTVNTYMERANASVEEVLRSSPYVRKKLRKEGKLEYDFFIAMRQAALIESAYYTRLGGIDMPENSKHKIDSALFRRTYKNTPLFKTIIDKLDINGLDGKELGDFAKDIDLTKVLQDIVSGDPYYRRRTNQISAFQDINSEESAGLKKVNTEDFFTIMLDKTVRKFPSMRKKIISLAKELEVEETVK